MSWIAVGATVVKVGGSMVAANAAKKAAKAGGGGTSSYEPLNIDQIIQDSRKVASENYQNSLNLEARFNPQQAALRNAATQMATNAAINPPGTTAYRGSEVGNSLLTESSQSILDSLRLGATLPADVQAEVARAALSKGGQAGLAGSFAGRGLVARDIGTTSLALQEKRQAQALAAGGVLEQLGLNRAQFGLAQEQAQNQNAYQFKLLADAFGLPESGISAGDVASLYAGKNNADNSIAMKQAEIDQQNANARAARINQMLGFGMQLVDTAAGAYGNYLQNRTPTLKTTTVGSGYGSDIPSTPGWTPSR